MPKPKKLPQYGDMFVFEDEELVVKRRRFDADSRTVTIELVPVLSEDQERAKLLRHSAAQFLREADELEQEPVAKTVNELRAEVGLPPVHEVALDKWLKADSAILTADSSDLPPIEPDRGDYGRRRPPEPKSRLSWPIRAWRWWTS
jgi:hypothetical protein